MREIKFRAWDKKKKEMFHVWNIRYGLGLSFSKGIKCISPPFDNDDARAIENIELMQYTGLKDKNGVEIYEGDIVKNGDEVYEVVFEYGMFCLGDLEFPLWKGNPSNYWEVIGNVHQNPDLIKEKFNK